MLSVCGTDRVLVDSVEINLRLAKTVVGTRSLTTASLPKKTLHSQSHTFASFSKAVRLEQVTVKQRQVRT